MSLPSTGGPCQSHDCTNYRSGHQLHWIHAKQVAKPHRVWRRLVVSRVEGQELLLTDPATQATIVAWHHHDLEAIVPTGEEVLVLEKAPTLLVGGTMLNVHLTGTLGSIEEGDDVTLGSPPVAVDQATGRGVVLRGR